LIQFETVRFSNTMSSIDRIADVVTKYCLDSIKVFCYVDYVLSTSETTQAAIKHLESKGLLSAVDAANPERMVRSDVERCYQCVAAMDEIKRVARRVFDAHFGLCEAGKFVFNQEISFSYACKMLTTMCPLRRHFSNHPSHKEIVRAELALALSTPLSAVSPDLLCMETMPERSEIDGFD